MAVQTLNVPVPPSNGDGPPVDASGLDGIKTVQISGTYSGTYTLLGSQDGTTYAPLVSFGSGASPQSFAKTNDVVVKFVKVRKFADGPPVEISLVADEASNQFVAFAPVTPGTRAGPLPAIDTWSVVPPSGFGSEGFSAICSGGFMGTIAIEGSLDGTSFSPLGFFRSGVPADGPAPLLSPISVPTSVRYLRLNVMPGTTISSPVQVTTGSQHGDSVDTLNGQVGDVAIVSRDARQIIDVPSDGQIRISQQSTADWALNVARTFLLDGINGDDSRSGFSDVPGPWDPTLLAKKTIAGISEIIPPNGAGRVGQLYVANGGVNTALEYPGLAAFLTQLNGYQFFGVAATGTNPNAGAVAFDGTANTQLYAGGITVPGLNVAGYNPTAAATTTSLPCTLNGGGAPNFPAEPSAPLGWSVRFDINTTTPALRGICKEIRQVAQVAGVDTIFPWTALPAPPSTDPLNPDVFYVEKAGVIFTNPFVGIGGTDTEGLSIVGIDFQAQVFVYGGAPSFMFCGCNSLVGARPQALAATNRVQGIAQPNGTITNRARGGSLRNAGSYTASFPGAVVSWQGGTWIGNVELLCIGGANAIQDANCFAGGLTIHGSFGDTNWNDAATALGGISATFPCRFIAAGTNVGFTSGLQIRGARLQLRNNDFENMGAHPAIIVVGMSDIVISGSLTGLTGNSDVGLDLTAAQGSRIYIRTLPTVSGTAGNVRLADGTIISWATAAAGVVDTAGNILFSSSTYPLHFTPVATGAATVAMTNAPNGSPAAPVRYVKLPDGAGGFWTFASLT